MEVQTSELEIKIRYQGTSEYLVILIHTEISTSFFLFV